MKLAIVGSTTLANNPEALAIVGRVIDKYDDGESLTVITGGAPGIDTVAMLEAQRRNIPVRLFRPTVQRWEGPGGFRERNLKMAEACDRLVRIADRCSRTYGSGWTRDRVREMGKPTEEFVVG